MTQRLTTGMAAIEPRFVLWRKVRLPLAVGVLVIIMVASGLLLRSMLIDRGIRRDLARATELVALDSFASHGEAHEMISKLARAHPRLTSVVTRDAWHRVLAGLRFGATAEQQAATKQAVAAAADLAADPLSRAVQAGFLVSAGDPEGALKKMGNEVSLREEMFVTALAFSAQGHFDQSIELLDRTRQGVPPFAPALTEMARLLRQRGRLEEAEAAVKVLKQVSPGHEGAAVEEVLLVLDRPGKNPDEAARGKLVQRLKAVTVDEDHPRTLAFQNQGLGRLELMAGQPGQAVTSLSQAANVLKTNQAVATWLARAHRQVGQHEAALKALAAFPDDVSSVEPLLQTRAAILLDLHRTDAAAAPLSVLSKTGTAAARLMEGRRLLYAGSPVRATKVLRLAQGQGAEEAALYLAQALMAVGRADRTKGALRALGKGSPLSSCGEGFSYFIAGNARRAAESLAEAAAAGGRCGAVLTGSLLLHSGGSVGLLPALEAALAQREDLLDRVTLARVRFRQEGAVAAGRDLDRVRSLNPEGAAVLRALALAYGEIGQPEKGLAVAQAGAELTKGHPMVVGAALELALATEQADKIRKLLRKARKNHELLPYLAVQRARFQLARKRLTDAAQAIEKALLPGPWYGEAACVASEITLRTDGAEDALRDLQRMAASARRSSGALVDARIRKCMFDLHLRRGPSSKNRAKGVVYFLRRMPLNWSKAAYLAGQLAEREGKRSDARDFYREALALDPGDHLVWRRLNRLGALTAEEQQTYQLLWPDRPLGGE